MEQIEQERKRLRRGLYYRRALSGTISVLVVVAAVAVLITTLFLPILQISGDSMSPTMEHDDIIVLFKTDELQRGDLIGFYYQGKIILTNGFVKKVQKTPRTEIQVAKARRAEYIERMRENENSESV